MSAREPQHHHVRESVIGMVARCPQCQRMYIPIDHSGCCESCWPESEQPPGEPNETTD